jgi:hypothetical protein
MSSRHRLLVAAGCDEQDRSLNGAGGSLDHCEAGNDSSSELNWQFPIRLPDDDGVSTAVAVRRQVEMGHARTRFRGDQTHESGIRLWSRQVPGRHGSSHWAAAA